MLNPNCATVLSHYKAYHLRYNLLYEKALNVFYKYIFFSNDLNKIILYPMLN